MSQARTCDQWLLDVTGGEKRKNDREESEVRKSRQADRITREMNRGRRGDPWMLNSSKTNASSPSVVIANEAVRSIDDG